MSSSDTVTCTFTADSTFVVPAVGELTVVAVGGDGGAGLAYSRWFSGTPGRGDHLTVPVPVDGGSLVSSGQTLRIRVGGNGKSGGVVVNARHLVLVAPTRAGYGKVEVKLDKRTLKTIKLNQGSGARRVLTIRNPTTPITGVVKVRTLNNKPVLIDGLGYTS